MITITKKSQRIHHIKYTFDYEDNDLNGAGWGFPCDKDGIIFPLEHQAGRDNLEYCKNNPDKVTCKGVYGIIMGLLEPAEGLCHCGRTIKLDGDSMAECDCPHCGRVYNIFGQELNGHTHPFSGMNEDGEYYSEEDY